MMQRPHEKMVCRMPDKKDSPPTPPNASPNASPNHGPGPTPKPRPSPGDGGGSPPACPACAVASLLSPSPMPVCKDKKPPMKPEVLVPDAKEQKKKCGKGKGVIGVITCFIKKVAAASKKFVSKLGKMGFQEVGVEILSRTDCMNADDLEDLVCKKAGACGDEKNECPKSKG